MTNYAQRNAAVQRKQMGSGAFVGIIMSLVFLVVAAGFAILGVLFITIPMPVVVLGVLLLLGAVVTALVSVGCIAESVRTLIRPAKAMDRVEALR